MKLVVPPLDVWPPPAGYAVTVEVISAAVGHSFNAEAVPARLQQMPAPSLVTNLSGLAVTARVTASNASNLPMTSEQQMDLIASIVRVSIQRCWSPLCGAAGLHALHGSCASRSRRCAERLAQMLSGACFRNWVCTAVSPPGWTGEAAAVGVSGRCWLTQAVAGLLSIQQHTVEMEGKCMSGACPLSQAVGCLSCCSPASRGCPARQQPASLRQKITAFPGWHFVSGACCSLPACDCYCSHGKGQAQHVVQIVSLLGTPCAQRHAALESSCSFAWCRQAASWASR